MTADRNGQWVRSTADLVGLALGLGAADVSGWTREERRLAKRVRPVRGARVTRARDQIRAGFDPLGEAFCRLRTPAERRPLGATYTSPEIVRAMVDWAAANAVPVRIVDPGAGSGRFTLAAAKAFRRAQLVGVEIDPLAAVVLRAQLRAAGVHRRATVVVGDFRRLCLSAVAGPTLFIGNPPYVRHHQIPREWKDWLVQGARRFGLRASQLAGLHVHFMLATATLGVPGDLGAFVTSAEWLDVNYGSLPRRLFLGPLGGQSIHLVEPTASVFQDAESTAAIACYRIGAAVRSVFLRRVASLGGLSPLSGGRRVRRERLESASRWSPLSRPSRKGPEGHVELGELCRVHRGQVTGANRVWVARVDTHGLPPAVLVPAVTRARELFDCGATLTDATALRRVIDLPEDLDVLSPEQRRTVAGFLRVAKRLGAADGYIARHRKAWWAVGLREPAPILATYMARRPPAFVRNLAGARHINIAHGLYPREPLSPAVLDGLAHCLSAAVTVDSGRTYAGGLTKFEPREMERLLVPTPEVLARAARRPDSG